jgi:hypothetical protein
MKRVNDRFWSWSRLRFRKVIAIKTAKNGFAHDELSLCQNELEQSEHP